VQLQETKTPGCYEIIPAVAGDARGVFVKTFREDVFAKHKLESHFVEEYYSISHRRVLRGLHFQIPPKACEKMVYCVSGSVLDVILDLRLGSPAYGTCEAFTLDSTKANILHIPAGVAHGFYVQSEHATLIYKTTALYSPAHDTGIRWDSVSFSWPDPDPIVSDRDKGFPLLKNFKSPFVYRGSERE
jgi:dTDP-4-dehydrorhamnose 3,5-epimerase